MVSVLILTKNGERYLPELISIIHAQRFDGPLEVVAVDSGSEDATLAILRAHPIRILEITPESFNHGETRNLAARTAHPDSEYLVYLSQDALPADDHWLHNLIRPMEDDLQVAGTFSRHIARPGASPSLVRQLTTQWQTGGSQRIVKQMPDDHAEYEANKGYLTYFSNTSSAIRRSVWDRIPFRELDFAEDADWADRALQVGHRIVFEPRSVVIHSHDYSIIEQFRQNVDHAYAMTRLFDPPAYRQRWLLLRQALRLPREVWRDWKFVRRSEDYAGASPSQQLRWMVRSPLWHLASFMGQWIGIRSGVLPENWRVFFGRQERLKRGIQDR